MTHIMRKQKVAALLLAIGENIAAEILRHLDKQEVIDILQTMRQLKPISSSTIEQVIKEFYKILMSSEEKKLTGGYDASRRFINAAFHGKKAEELHHAVGTVCHGLPAIQNVPAETLAEIIRKEHPQTIALVLACCQPAQAAQLLRKLPQHLRADLLIRMASLQEVREETLNLLNESLRKTLEQRSHSAAYPLGGERSVAEMLARMDKESASSLLESLSHKNPELSEKIRDKMFLFEDLKTLRTTDLRLLIQQTPQKELLLAMRLADTALKEKIYACLSSRAATILRDDMDASPPASRQEILSAQKNILTRYHKLTEAGNISDPKTKFV